MRETSLCGARTLTPSPNSKRDFEKSYQVINEMLAQKRKKFSPGMAGKSVITDYLCGLI